MRKSLLLYLFSFAALLAIYFYFSGQNIIESKEEEIQGLRQELEAETARIGSLSSEISEARSFSLVSNDEALTYLEDRGFDPAEVIRKVEEALISRNMSDADNDLIPYRGMDGFFRINKVKLLNHKWAIASFTDGRNWGDLFISYELDEEGNISVTSEKAVLYPVD